MLKNEMLKILAAFVFFMPAAAYAADDASPGLLLAPESFAAHSIPDSLSLEAADLQDYAEGDKISLYSRDLNSDSHPDFLLRSNSSICGTGGCSYLLIDGATKQTIGQFSGNPLLILNEQSNNYPVIQTYSHGSADTGTFVTYKYDSGKYVVSDHADLSGQQITDLVAKLKTFKKAE